MLSGASGEHVGFVQLTGPVRDKVLRAFLKYGTVSTEFPETNAFADGRMDEFCRSFSQQELIG